MICGVVLALAVALFVASYVINRGTAKNLRETQELLAEVNALLDEAPSTPPVTES